MIAHHRENKNVKLHNLRRMFEDWKTCFLECAKNSNSPAWIFGSRHTARSVINIKFLNLNNPMFGLLVLMQYEIYLSGSVLLRINPKSNFNLVNTVTTRDILNFDVWIEFFLCTFFNNFRGVLTLISFN